MRDIQDHYRRLDPADVIRWIDTAKRQSPAVEVTFLAHWAFHTGRAITWNPFCSVSQTDQWRHFNDAYQKVGHPAGSNRVGHPAGSNKRGHPAGSNKVGHAARHKVPAPAADLMDLVPKAPPAPHYLDTMEKDDD